jgi:hypothetical protein
MAAHGQIQLTVVTAVRRALKASSAARFPGLPADALTQRVG